jgi:hypothetical protein
MKEGPSRQNNQMVFAGLRPERAQCRWLNNLYKFLKSTVLGNPTCGSDDPTAEFSRSVIVLLLGQTRHQRLLY